MLSHFYQAIVLTQRLSPKHSKLSKILMRQSVHNYNGSSIGAK